MTQLLVVVVGAVGALTVVNFLLSMALIRRVRVLQELVEQTPRRDPSLPQMGAVIGSFQATTLEGEPLSNETLKPGVSLVGFFTTHCKPCAALRTQLLESPPALPFVAFVEGSVDDPEVGAMAEALKRIARVVYTQNNDALHQAFKPAGYPTLLRVENGVIAASGHTLAEVLP
ncbi:TlpA family protein disulfide reductase [Archangium sp.]|uniref:TlpA family protein disulfide reductase n=1 Tax=Archangium sp. TaxID=1872627 RepID=UPI00389A1DAB